MTPNAKAVLRIAGCVAAVLGMVAAFQFQLIVVEDRPLTVALIGIIAVLIVSVAWGYGYAILLSFLATLGFNWLVPPGGWFHDDPRNWLALAAFLITGITASKLSERALRKARDADERRDEAAAAQQRFADLVNSLEGIVWEADAETFAFSFVSEQAERVLGYPTAQWLQEPGFWKNHLHPEDRDWAVQFWQQAVAENRNYDFEYRMIAADGSILWLRDLVTMVVEGGRPTRLRGVMVNTTRGRRAEEQLRRSEAYLAEAQKLTHTGSWAWDPNRDGVGLYWSEEMFRIHGVDPEQPIPDWEAFQLVHSDDRDRVRELVMKAVRDKSDLATDYRVVLADGTLKHLDLIGHAVFEKNGTLVEYVGTLVDVTERKRAEEALRRSEAYLAEAQRLSHTGSFAYDPGRKKSLYWSEELFRIFKLDPQRGIPDYDETRRLVHPDDLDMVSNECLQGFREKAEFSQTYRLLLHDGTVKHLHVIWHPVLDKAGELVEYVGTAADVTETEQLTQKLLRSEFYLSEGQRLARMGSWSFTPDGICDYWSQELYSILGFDPAMGIPTIADYLKLVHPEDREFVEGTIHRMIREGEGCDVKKRIIRPDGEERVIHCVGIPVRANGIAKRFVGTLMDVTEQELLSQELRQREAYLAEAQRLSHTGSFGWNVSTDEHFWSDETFRIFEYEASTKITMQLVFERVHPQDIPLVQKVVARAAEESDLDFEYRLVMPSGSVKYVHVVAHVFREESGCLEFVGAVMDVTERKRAEEALHEAREDLARITRLTTMGEFVASIAHEVNQPLAAIMTSGNACLNWMAGKPPNLPKAREAVRRIVRDANRAGEVLTRIRNLIKKAPPTKSRLSANGIIRDVLVLAAGELRRHGVEVSLDLEENLPPVTADPVQLQQILLNLIVNAIEAMTGISGRAKTLRIESSVQKLDGSAWALVAVIDSGVGLDPLDMDRLFEAFHTTKPQGMGMGLWISRSIVEAHGGRLTAQPNTGPGATFQVLLPTETEDSR